MAPTEVLAKQHFESICEMLEEYQIPVRVELLTGSMTAKEKRMAYERIASGEAQIIVGTHALIQEKVKYHSLALVVTDEQHRFGVKQREKLAEKRKHTTYSCDECNSDSEDTCNYPVWGFRHLCHR